MVLVIVVASEFFSDFLTPTPRNIPNLTSIFFNVVELISYLMLMVEVCNHFFFCFFVFSPPILIPFNFWRIS